MISALETDNAGEPNVVDLGYTWLDCNKRIRLLSDMSQAVLKIFIASRLEMHSLPPIHKAQTACLLPNSSLLVKTFCTGLGYVINASLQQKSTDIKKNCFNLRTILEFHHLFFNMIS